MTHAQGFGKWGLVRKVGIGLMMTVFGPVVALIGDHYTSGASNWVWAALATLSVLAGLSTVLISNPVGRLLSPLGRRHRLLSTVIVFLVCGLLGAAAWFSVLSQDPSHDYERPDVHVTEANLQIDYDENRKLVATAIALVVRNLGKRPATNVLVRMWLGYDIRAQMDAVPVISNSIRVLDPGPYDPAR